MADQVDGTAGREVKNQPSLAKQSDFNNKKTWVCCATNKGLLPIYIEGICDASYCLRLQVGLNPLPLVLS